MSTTSLIAEKDAIPVRRLIAHLSTLVGQHLCKKSPPLAAKHPVVAWMPNDDILEYGMIQAVLLQQAVRDGLSPIRHGRFKDVEAALCNLKGFETFRELQGALTKLAYQALASVDTPDKAAARHELNAFQTTLDHCAMSSEQWMKKSMAARTTVEVSSDIDISLSPTLLPTSKVATTTEPAAMSLAAFIRAVPDLLPTAVDIDVVLASYTQFRRAIIAPQTFATVERQLPVPLETRLYATSVAYRNLVSSSKYRQPVDTVFKAICAALAFAVVGNNHNNISRLHALSIPLQIDALACSIDSPTDLERAFLAYLFGFAREVVAHSYLPLRDNKELVLATSLGHALNPEALFFGTGVPLSCPNPSCTRPLLPPVTSSRRPFMDTIITDRLSVGSHHSRADYAPIRVQIQGGDSCYYPCPITLLQDNAPSKATIILFFQYGQLEHHDCKFSDSPKTRFWLF